MRRSGQTNRRRRQTSRRAWLVVGLVLFVVVDLILVALALGWNQGQIAPESTPTQGLVEASEEPEETVSEEPSPESTPPQEEPSSEEQGRLLSVVSSNVAWRSEAGQCQERGSIELTVDGGQTWGGVYPSEEDLGHPMWLSGTDYTTLQVALASGEECDREGFYTADSGASWAADEQAVDSASFVDPNAPSRLVWAGEETEGPCEEIVDTAVSLGAATLVCSDGSLFSAESPSQEWVKHAVEGAVAVGGSQGLWMAAVETAQCDGLALVELDQDFFQMINCVTGNPDEAIALDISGSTLWLWTGDEVRISADGGRSLS